MRRIVGLPRARPETQTRAPGQVCRRRCANHRRRCLEAGVAPPSACVLREQAPRRGGKFSSRACGSSARSGNAAGRNGELQRLHLEADSHATGVRGWRPWLAWSCLSARRPGGDEDRIGRPFVGRAGQLLDRMLKVIGLRSAARLHRQYRSLATAGQPNPDAPGGTQTCLPFIERQIHLANPEFLVCLGASAARTLLRVEGGIMRARGSWFDYPHQNGAEIRALAMLHPAFLVTTTRAKAICVGGYANACKRAQSHVALKARCPQDSQASPDSSRATRLRGSRARLSSPPFEKGRRLTPGSCFDLR